MAEPSAASLHDPSRVRVAGSPLARAGAVAILLHGRGGSADDIASVSIENGMFTIKRRDAKVGWFSAKGVFSFAYDSMANAKVFLMAVDELLGLTYNPLPQS